MTAFYEDPTSFPFIERAVLLEDVFLPIINKKKKLKRGFFYTIHRLIDHENQIYMDEYPYKMMNDEFKLAYNEIKNIDAKFYVPVLMAGMTNSSSKQEISTDNRAPKTTGFKGNIRSLPFNSTNYTTLTIPKYIIFQFLDHKTEKIGEKDPFIPKGTEFLVACVGGAMDVETMRIIGLYTLNYNPAKFPDLKDDYYGGNPVR